MHGFRLEVTFPLTLFIFISQVFRPDALDFYDAML